MAKFKDVIGKLREVYGDSLDEIEFDSITFVLVTSVPEGYGVYVETTEEDYMRTIGILEAAKNALFIGGGTLQ